MDLLTTLRTKINRIEDGDHTPGLLAVLLHIETAIKHLNRGQASRDDTAFTDAIYRTNQAFEGSIKEAYRVIAGSDPDTKRPYDIEEYLQANHVLRDRVLQQFSNYRKQWRNPSTHDYKLDFDESEAFLAIISVAGFACVLMDQIAEKLSYAKSKATADAQSSALKASLGRKTDDLAIRLVDILTKFAESPVGGGALPNFTATEHHLIGALTGFLSSMAPDLEVGVEPRLGPNARPDLVISDGTHQVIIEIKRVGRLSGKIFEVGLAQVEHYLRLAGIPDGILYLHGSGKMVVAEHPMQTGFRVFTVRPAEQGQNRG